jgi:hypothetical protein
MGEEYSYLLHVEHQAVFFTEYYISEMLQRYGIWN